MEAGLLSEVAQLDIPDWQQCSGAEDAVYFSLVERFVSEKKDTVYSLKNPPNSKLRIAGLDDTIYSEKEDEVNGWGEFYLPDIVRMQVIGVVEGTSCPCDQLVLMTCEDKKVYAYDGEELHLVASSLEQLCDNGIEYPASKTYYNGEAFKDMTEDEWAEVRSGDVGQMLEKKHQELVKANKSKVLECLKSIGHK